MSETIETIKRTGMKKIKLYIAASLDGYIARPDGDLDWLMEFSNPSKEDYGYKDFFESVDTVIMGGRTYRDIICMDVVWPYTDKTTYVVTRNPIMVKENINLITKNIIETIHQLREENGKDIWLVGGGELITMLLNQDLVNEMIITYIPVILGNGIPLFPNNPKESKWNLVENKGYKNGVLQVQYKIKQSDWLTIKNSIIESLLSRGLASPNIRMNALNRIEDILKTNMPQYIINPLESFSKVEKNHFKEMIAKYKENGKLNTAESSIINEFYYRI